MNKIARLCLLVLAWIFGIIPHSCIAAEDDKRPPEHLCPITQAVMIDPVVAADGQSYEIDNLTRRIAVLEERLRENPNTDAVPRPVVSDIVIPDIARGYEEVYRRFFKGALIYKKGQPDEVRLPFSDLANPLEGTFDLSRCGDSGQHLSISTGYRKGKKAENANKVEIWLAPRFLIESNPDAAAMHYQPIMGGWNAAAAPAGIFWDWGGWNVLDWFEYLTTNSLEQLGSEDLWEKYKKGLDVTSGGPSGATQVAPHAAWVSRFIFELK